MKRLLAAVLVVIMVFSVFPLSAFAAKEEATAATLSGSGTTGDPYLIHNLEELELFRDNVNAGKTYKDQCFQLAADIVMNAPDVFVTDETGTVTGVDEAKEPYIWTPIGNDTAVFSGIFDGADHKIEGLYINEVADYQGLFGHCKNATVKNISIESGYIYQGFYCGGIIAFNDIDGGDSVVQSCINKASISQEKTKTYCHQLFLGGIIGRNNLTSGSVTVQDCNNTGNIMVDRTFSGIFGTSADRVGGIVGGNSVTSGTVSVMNAQNSGKIVFKTINVYFPMDGIGGIVGKSELSAGETSVSQCHNEGAIIYDYDDSSYSPQEGVTDFGVGGIVGCDYCKTNSANAIIAHCENDANVSGIKSVGGIVGHSSGELRECRNNATASGQEYIGGIAGVCTSEKIKSKLTGSVNTGAVSGNEDVGGICGFAYMSSNFLLKECYNTGVISGVTNTAGIIGDSATSSIAACYNTGAITGETRTAGIAAAASGAYISQCYNTGIISGTDVSAAIAINTASKTPNSSVTYCYYLENTATSGVVSNEEANARYVSVGRVNSLSEEEMHDMNSYGGFSFGETWFMHDNPHFPYPLLLALRDSYTADAQPLFTMRVNDESGKEITSGFTVNWYEKGSDTILSSGKELLVYETDKSYEYQIVLGESLLYTYKQPARADALAQGEDKEIDFTLTPIGALSLTGKVTDVDKNPIAGAEVTLIQQYSKKYSKTVCVSTGKDGSFAADIANVPTVATIEATGYYSKTKPVLETETELNALDLGTLSLLKLPENKIALTLKRTEAQLPEEAATYTQLMSLSGITFTLFNQTRNKAISGFSVQYPYIYLEDNAADANDEIIIQAIDKNETMTAESVSVTLNERKIADCTISFVENGRFSLGNITGNDANIMMIFDSNGKCVSATEVSANMHSDPLAQGDYSLVFMKKTDLLQSVSSYAQLATFGLKAGTDYLLKNLSVSNGLITELGDIKVPELNENKIAYTVAESTSFSAGSATAAIGKYVVMRCAYKVDDKYASGNEALNIELPSGVEVVSGSLTVNGRLKDYSVNGGGMHIQTNQKEGVVRFYVVSTKAGKMSAHASLSMRANGNQVTQPIGTATFTAESSKMSFPETTGKKWVSVIGTTMANSTVSLFDNGTKVGTIKSNASGSWTIRFELVEPYDYSFHNLHAQIENPAIDNTIVTDSQLLIYDANYYEVAKVTMYNTTGIQNASQEVTEFDFLNPTTKTKSFFYSPWYPTFSFKVEFTGGDDSCIHDVFVVTKSDSGVTNYIPVQYSKSSGVWYGSHEYKSERELPVSVNVAFNFYNEDVQTVINQSYINQKQANMQKDADERYEKLSEFFDVQVKKNDVSETGGKTISYRLTPKSEPREYMDVTVNEKVVKDFNPTQNDDEDNKEFFEFTNGEGEHYYYKQEIDQEHVEKVLFEQSTSTLVTMTYSYVKENAAKARYQNSRESLTHGAVSIAANYAIPVIGDIMAGITSIDLALRVENIYDQILNNLDNNACLTDMEKDNIRRIAQRNRDQILDNIGFDPVDTVLGFIAGQVGGAAAGAMGTTVSVGTYIGIRLNLMDLGNQMNRSRGKGRWGGKPGGELMGVSEDPNCNAQQPPQKPPQGAQPMSVIRDPSGYVYEAVPSNRLEGVKAQAYYYDFALDEFGIPAETKSDILWNAEEYDQVNPLYTDADGRYAWDVPEGEWLVKFSKEGYYDTDSRHVEDANEDGYLTVPPPQTEVNVGMVSKAAPKVASLNIYDEEIEFEFTQYMNIDSVNAQNITVKIGGVPVKGTITPTNAEYDYEQVHQYASHFRFVPEAKFEGTVTFIAENCINYAGKPLASRFTATDTVEEKPTQLVVNDALNVAFDSGALLEIGVLSPAAGAHKAVTVTSSSPSIANIVNEEIVTDENGKVNVMIAGNMPGTAQLTVSVDGTELKKNVTVTVGGVESGEDYCQKVEASVENGSDVEKGTLLTLSTPTQGAEIYYTLDGTCPCVTDSPSRIKYNAPIEINEDMFIIAYAVKSGLKDSNTAGFVFKIKQNAALKGSVSIEGSTAVGSELSAKVNLSVGDITALTYRWYADDVLIPGAQSSTYVIRPEDAEKEIKVIVTSSDGAYTGELVGTTVLREHYWQTTVIEPTCTQAGYTIYTCACGETFKSDYVNALGHTPAAAIKEHETAASCKKQGSYESVVKCSVCGEEISRETVAVAMTAHTFKSTKTVKASTVKAGYTDQKCTVCGKSRRVINAPTGKIKTVKCKSRSASAQTIICSGIKNAQGYRVQVSTDGKTWKTYDAKKKTSLTFKKLAAGKNYYFRVCIYAKGIDGKYINGAWTKQLASPTLPKGTSLKKLTSAKKAFTATWKQNTAVSGYQVQFATKSNFSGAKSVTIKNRKTLKTTFKKLKGKKVYYVRIRTYKSLNSKNYFSTWSKVAKVKTK